MSILRKLKGILGGGGNTERMDAQGQARLEQRGQELSGLSEKVSLTSLPRLALTRKPGREEFKALRDRLTDEACAGVNPYCDYVFSLGTIGHVRQFRNMIDFTVRDFIRYFWDVPSSHHHHHAAPWGHVLHSLEVACIEAEAASHETIFSGADIDSERSKKNQGFTILGGFLVGLFHDAGKIYDLELTSRIGQTVYAYNPNQGGVLNFKLAHPAGLTLNWTPLRSGAHKRRNLFIMLNMIPRGLFYYMPKEVFLRTIDRLLAYDGLHSDKQSVASNLAQDNALGKVMDTIGEMYAQNKFLLNMPGQSSAYKIDDNYYIVFQKRFLDDLAARTGMAFDSLKQLLLQNDVIVYRRDSGDYYREVQVYLRTDKEEATATKIMAMFVQAAFLDDPIKAFQGTAPGVSQARIAPESRAVVLELFGDRTPPTDSAYYAPSSRPQGRQGYQPPPTAKLTSDVPEITPTAPAVKTDAALVGASPGGEALAGKLLTKFLSRFGSEFQLQGKNVTNMGFVSPDDGLWLLHPRATDASLDCASMSEEEKKSARTAFLKELKALGLLIPIEDNLFAKTKVAYFVPNAVGGPPILETKALFVLRINTQALELPEAFKTYLKPFLEANARQRGLNDKPDTPPNPEDAA